MPKRPLIRKGIAELEKLFDQRRADPQFLNDLIEELSARKTQRAQELRQRVMQAKKTVAAAPQSIAGNNTRQSVRESSSMVTVAPLELQPLAIPEPAAAPAATNRR